MDYPPEATFYIRISFMEPKPGKGQLVAGLVDNLLDFFSTQPGYVRGYKLIEGDPQRRIGRVSLWETEDAADKAAQQQHVLTVRSELMQLVEGDSHLERSFTAIDPQLAKAAPA